MTTDIPDPKWYCRWLHLVHSIKLGPVPSSSLRQRYMKLQQKKDGLQLAEQLKQYSRLSLCFIFLIDPFCRYCIAYGHFASGTVDTCLRISNSFANEVTNMLDAKSVVAGQRYWGSVAGFGLACWDTGGHNRIPISEVPREQLRFIYNITIDSGSSWVPWFGTISPSPYTTLRLNNGAKFTREISRKPTISGAEGVVKGDNLLEAVLWVLEDSSRYPIKWL